METMLKEWIQATKDDIQKKYSIIDPTFIIERQSASTEELADWLNKYVAPPYLWVKYKHLQDTQFELFPFSPDPSDNVSQKLINDFLKDLNLSPNSLFTLNRYNIYDEDIEGITLYNEREIKHEMRFLLRKGYSKINLIKTSFSKNEHPVFHLHIGLDTLENMLKAGYLQLEYF